MPVTGVKEPESGVYVHTGVNPPEEEDDSPEEEDDSPEEEDPVSMGVSFIHLPSLTVNEIILGL